MDFMNKTGADQDLNKYLPFCRSKVWDSDITWNTEYPDFTSCFKFTLLIYIPAGILFIGFPFEINKCLTSRHRLIPWGFLNISKIILVSIQIVLAVFELGLILGPGIKQTQLEVSMIVAPVLKIICYSGVIALILLARVKGQVSSGVLFLFWSSLIFTSIPGFRDAIQTMLETERVENSVVMLSLTVIFQYIITVSLFISSFWADQRPKYIDLDDDIDNITPEVFASFPSKLVFYWFETLVRIGWKRVILPEDIWGLKMEDRSKTIVSRWEKFWKPYDQTLTQSKYPSVLVVLVKCYGWDYIPGTLCYLIYCIALFIPPQIVNYIIGFIESDEPFWHGYFYVAVLGIFSFISLVFNHQSWYRQQSIGLRVRTALTAAIYRKSLKLSCGAKNQIPTGETLNMMSIDTQKFYEFVSYINFMWANPLQIILCIYFLWGILGPSSLAGVAVLVMLIPINSYIGRKMNHYQKLQMKKKDQRTKFLDETLNGIKVLKLYAWESSFKQKLLRIRDSEVQSLKKVAFFDAITNFLFICTPFLVAISSFTVYVLVDENNILDPQTAFVALTYFNLLRQPLSKIPMLILLIVQCNVSTKRINKFMNNEELDPLNVTHDEGFDHPVFAEQADFTWDDESKPNLKGISMRVEEGSLVAVVGQVGSGKSSLLSAMLGEMKRVRGAMNLKGKVAYAAQQAWIQNSTLQDNITFGKRFNKDLYDRVIESCALKQDLEMLPGGDQTEIGEKGINLSGGQKQRVSIARSVYSNGSLYLLDDPLSAVDAHVGKHIFKKVIGPKGLLKNKTRVLVTHGVSFLPVVDKIFVMKDGEITESGSYKDLLDKKGAFADFLIQYLTNNEDSENPETETELLDLKFELENTIGKKTLETRLSKERSEKSSLNSQISSLTALESPAKHTSENITNKANFSQLENLKNVGKDLIVTEKTEVGNVKFSIYSYYARSIGYAATIAILVCFTLNQGFAVGSNLWLSRWSNDIRAANDTRLRNMYLGVYGALGVLQSVFVLIGTLLFLIFSLEASKLMHNSMLERILKAPMSFFDTNPLGRILNRFSKDIDAIDSTLPTFVRSWINQLLSAIGTVIAVVFAIPVFILVFIPLVILFVILQKSYITTARQVKRIDSISKSPIFNHFGETLSGSATIRAFDKIEQFELDNQRHIDYNQMFTIPSYLSNKWLGIRIETLTGIFLTLVALFSVIFKGKIDPGLVGLSLSYAVSLSAVVYFLVRDSGDVETNMVSVERIQEYQEVPQEAPFDIPENDPEPEWPEHGEVWFDNYQTRYREGLDLVLKGIDCHILSGEKVGIVGRTGAGKSSLTLALFRLIEPSGGSILIDGIHISQLGLSKLRSRITIIPQDPVLFSGTIRSNLDPFQQFTDSKVWKALEQTNLNEMVSRHQKKLEFEVSQGGENLSVGQRQLICLARALLRKTKVLVLDEATAAVDLETDDLVQATIRSEFVDSTVITIAHRLNTILDSNRVMVLDAGKIAEFDSPQNLMKDTSSIFYGMAKNAGLVAD
ncbi:canalicular multispecific organic anion transporter 2 isoform X2 [Eurytemora carolleeae]|uniref:canalicular multispecific organic anion transporter 2 isoform X2 n=1 Tax=Eurytemora carolleeae TaxID=1294199 RepID=UPI000C76C775|nr:canalicular multispecific organic anion transporter 2 isoform X2 [Eurytemora carolleeae]|eukprot:XP_023349637.1 canalicular multispecific organic anion transporter 2-like isoform X2 [Eurytemora affinis]